jgi:hypothetical protein
LLVLFALVVCLGLPGSAQNRVRSSIGTTLNQCENGTTGVADCTGSAWITGNLNPNNSLYREGDFVPFRSRITNLVAGRTYAFRIGYDAVEKGLHAYDYLGSVDGSESAPGQQVSPCDGVGDTAGAHACGNAPSTLAVPTDTSTTFPPGVGQKDGAFSAWGAALTGAAYVSPAPIVVGSSGTVERSIDVTFTAEGPTVVLAWGGHIASVVDWGAGRTFISAASGSSFHMRLLRVQEGPPSGPVTSTGNQEVSLQATALAPQPSPFTTQIDRTPVEVGSAVVDTATLSGKAGAPVTGVVNFFVCFNSASRPTCTVGRTQVGTGQVLAAPSATSPDGVASVQFVPDTPGSYCFRTEYVPSATALYSPAVHTDTTTECFEAVVTRPLLTLTKICVPATNGRFNLLLDGAAVLSDAACGASAGPVPTTAGSHTVGETAGTATNLTDYTTTIGGDCAPTGSITLTNGQSATCTITNELKGSGVVPGTLTVNKLCPPGADGLFELHVDSLRFPDVACGGGTGPVTLEAGTHTVGEAAGTGTSLADFTTVIGGACAPDGSVTVPPGGAATCTITNTPIPVPPATLTVTKLCVPGSDARFTITVDGKPSGTVGCGGSTHAVEVTAGEHAVGETGAGDTDLSDYTVVQGGDCEADGTIVVDAGEHATCTITNVLKTKPPVVPSTLTVTKVCVPSDDGGLFTLMIDGHGSADQPCGDRLGPIVVSPGAHSVSEAAGARTSLADLHDHERPQAGSRSRGRPGGDHDCQRLPAGRRRGTLPAQPRRDRFPGHDVR